MTKEEYLEIEKSISDPSMETEDLLVKYNWDMFSLALLDYGDETPILDLAKITQEAWRKAHEFEDFKFENEEPHKATVAEIKDANTFVDSSNNTRGSLSLKWKYDNYPEKRISIIYKKGKDIDELKKELIIFARYHMQSNIIKKKENN